MRALNPELRNALLVPLRRLRYRGSARFCPVCRSAVSQFLPFGAPPRPQAQCPVCHALERHRLLWLFLHQRTDLFDGRPRRMLHVAPERQLARRFRRIPGVDYLSVDLDPAKAMQQADITALSFADATFDVIYCSHVLEHVPEDRQAMREFYRVLKPGGWAVLQVPIRRETTLEDPSVTAPEERMRLFGQHDHVRVYGLDYKDRLEEAGFTVAADRFARDLPAEEAERTAINREEIVFYCTKPV